MDKKIIGIAIGIITIFSITFVFSIDLDFINIEENITYENSTHNEIGLVYSPQESITYDNSTNTTNITKENNFLILQKPQIPEISNYTILINQAVIQQDNFPKILKLGESYQNNIFEFNYTLNKNVGFSLDPEPYCNVFEGEQPWLIFRKLSMNLGNGLIYDDVFPFGSIIPFGILKEKNIEAFIITDNSNLSKLLDKCHRHGQTQFNLPQYEEPKYLLLTSNQTNLIVWDLEY